MNRNKLVVPISMWNTLRTYSFWLKHIFNTMSFYAAFSTLFTKTFVQNVTFTQEKSWENHFLCIFFNIFSIGYIFTIGGKLLKNSMITCFAYNDCAGTKSLALFPWDFQTDMLSPCLSVCEKCPLSNFELLARVIF